MAGLPQPKFKPSAELSVIRRQHSRGLLGSALTVHGCDTTAPVIKWLTTPNVCYFSFWGAWIWEWLSGVSLVQGLSCICSQDVSGGFGIWRLDWGSTFWMVHSFGCLAVCRRPQFLATWAFADATKYLHDMVAGFPQTARRNCYLFYHPASVIICRAPGGDRVVNNVGVPCGRKSLLRWALVQLFFRVFGLGGKSWKTKKSYKDYL